MVKILKNLYLSCLAIYRQSLFALATQRHFDNIGNAYYSDFLLYASSHRLKIKLVFFVKSHYVGT